MHDEFEADHHIFYVLGEEISKIFFESALKGFLDQHLVEPIHVFLVKLEEAMTLFFYFLIECYFIGDGSYVV